MECFEGDVRQVLSNLVTNAIDAMSTGGRSAAVFTTIVRAFVACFIDGLGFVPAGLAFVGWWTYFQEVFLNLITVILVSLRGNILIGSRSFYSSGIDAFELALTLRPTMGLAQALYTVLRHQQKPQSVRIAQLVCGFSLKPPFGSAGSTQAKEGVASAATSS